MYAELWYEKFTYLMMYGNVVSASLGLNKEDKRVVQETRTPRVIVEALRGISEKLEVPIMSEEDPEVSLLSFLLAIQEDLNGYSPHIDICIMDMAVDEEFSDKARKLLGRKEIETST
jgi:hypothetical protein